MNKKNLRKILQKSQQKFFKAIDAKIIKELLTLLQPNSLGVIIYNVLKETQSFFLSREVLLPKVFFNQNDEKSRMQKTLRLTRFPIDLFCSSLTQHFVFNQSCTDFFLSPTATTLTQNVLLKI